MTYVVVELGVGNGDEVGSMRDVEKTVVEVLVAGDAVVRELSKSTCQFRSPWHVFVAIEAVGSTHIHVVHPDLGRLLDLNQVLALGRVLELHVANNDVAGTLDAEATTSETCRKLLA